MMRNTLEKNKFEMQYDHKKIIYMEGDRKSSK